MPAGRMARVGYILVGLASLLLMAILAGCSTFETLVAGPTITPAPLIGTRLDPPRELPDFTLTSQTGDPLSLSDLSGQPVLLFFGYTHCPDVCPLTLAEFNRVSLALGEEADQVHFVFISVDGERDTPERLNLYLSGFNAAFIGLTGDEATLRRIGVDYGLYFEREEAPGSAVEYLVAHTASSFLIDPEGRLSIVYPYRTPPDIIAADIHNILALG